MRNNRKEISIWNTEAVNGKSITVELANHFNARGMKKVYGRGENFPRSPCLNLDIWRHTSGTLFARFWSHGSEVDWESYAIKGMEEYSFPIHDEKWVPDQLRNDYDSWLISSMNF